MSTNNNQLQFSFYKPIKSSTVIKSISERLIGSSLHRDGPELCSYCQGASYCVTRPFIAYDIGRQNYKPPLLHPIGLTMKTITDHLPRHDKVNIIRNAIMDLTIAGDGSGCTRHQYMNLCQNPLVRERYWTEVWTMRVLLSKCWFVCSASLLLSNKINYFTSFTPSYCWTIWARSNVDSRYSRQTK